jgi:hypothetical protein
MRIPFPSHRTRHSDVSKGLSRNNRYISLSLVRGVGARHALPWATSREERGIAPTVTAVHPIGTVVLGQTLSPMGHYPRGLEDGMCASNRHCSG